MPSHDETKVKWLKKQQKHHGSGLQAQNEACIPAELPFQGPPSIADSTPGHSSGNDIFDSDDEWGEFSPPGTDEVAGVITTHELWHAKAQTIAQGGTAASSQPISDGPVSFTFAQFQTLT